MTKDFRLKFSPTTDLMVLIIFDKFQLKWIFLFQDNISAKKHYFLTETPKNMFVTQRVETGVNILSILHVEHS
jgi:hypothetical protein